jgi:hypothetical protein
MGGMIPERQTIVVSWTEYKEYMQVLEGKMQTESTSGAAASLLKIGDLHRGRQRPTVRGWALEEALET